MAAPSQPVPPTASARSHTASPPPPPSSRRIQEGEADARVINLPVAVMASAVVEAVLRSEADTRKVLVVRKPSFRLPTTLPEMHLAVHTSRRPLSPDNGHSWYEPDDDDRLLAQLLACGARATAAWICSCPPPSGGGHHIKDPSPRPLSTNVTVPCPLKDMCPTTAPQASGKPPSCNDAPAVVGGTSRSSGRRWTTSSTALSGDHSPAYLPAAVTPPLKTPPWARPRQPRGSCSCSVIPITIILPDLKLPRLIMVLVHFLSSLWT